MTTAYTSLLGLALPVTGELSGTWGDTVNTAITSLLDTAIAGTTSITTDADITLSTTTGASNQARQAIILWNPASGTTTRNITAPAQSKMYVVINASGGTQSIVIRGAGPTTGVTIAKGESATVAWNGSDFVKVSSSGGAITFTDLTVTGNTILGDAAADTLTVNATSTFNAPVSFAGLVRLPSTGRSAAAALTVTAPAFLYGVASTYTDTTSSGTIAAMAPFYALSAPTLSTSNVTTYSFASTLYVAGAPAAGGSATITNPYALYINSGASYLAGAVSLGSTLAVAGATNLNGAVTLGDAAADNITVTGTITSNLLFTDNTYDIGASGATRPRTGYFGTSLQIGTAQASIQFSTTGTSATYTSAMAQIYDLSTSTGGPSNGLIIKRDGGNTGFYSAALSFDVGGGGGGAKMYTSRLSATGGIFYLNTDATNGVSYTRVQVNQLGEWTWLNNSVNTGATAMTLSGQNLVVNGQIQSNLEDGLVSTSQNAANNGIYLQVRPYSGQSGYLTFTENSIADRWAIGIQPGDGTLYFRAGQVTATAVATLNSSGKLALGAGTIYGSSALSLPWQGISSATSAIYNIDTLTAAPFRGSFGEFVFKSSSSFANNAAQAMLYLAARNYGSTPGTANDVTQGVGLWIRGFYDNSGAAVPIYLGGYSYNSTNYGLVIDQSSRVTAGVGNSSSDTQKFNVVGNIKIAGAQASNVANLIMTRTDSSWSVNNETELRFYNSTSDTDTPSNLRFEIQSAGNVRVPTVGAILSVGSTTNPVGNRTGTLLFAGYTGSYGASIQSWVPSGSPGIDYQDLRFYTSAGPAAIQVRRASITPYGVLTVNDSGGVGAIGGLAVINGNASINSAAYPGSSVYDTGISVNQGSGGGTMLFLCSVNTSAGTNTTSGVYMIQFYYDGNNAANPVFVSGSNSWTFGKSASQTLTVTGPGGNAYYAWFANK